MVFQTPGINIIDSGHCVDEIIMGCKWMPKEFIDESASEIINLAVFVYTL
jgi:hypothetical protein